MRHGDFWNLKTVFWEIGLIPGSFGVTIFSKGGMWYDESTQLFLKQDIYRPESQYRAQN